MSGVARRRSSSPRGRSGRPRTQQPQAPVYATQGEMQRLEGRINTIAGWGPHLQEMHDNLKALVTEMQQMKTNLAQQRPWQQQAPQGYPQSHPPAAGVHVPDPAATNGPTSYGRSGREVKIEMRGIEKYKKFGGVAADYDDWRDQIAEHACFGNPELEELLRWAEVQPSKISEVDESIKSTDANIDYDVQAVSGMLFALMSRLVEGSMRTTKKLAGDHRGLEFWRIMHKTYGSGGNHDKASKLRRYMHPERVKDAKDLHAALEQWEVLGQDCGIPMSDELRAISLEQLVPTSIWEKLVTEPALQTLQHKVDFVKTYVRSVRDMQTMQNGAKPPPRKGKDDMDISNVEKKDEEWDDEEQGEDQEGDINYIRGKGKGQKGDGKGGKGAGKEKFRGKCNYCLKPGHKEENCWHKHGKPPKGGGKGGVNAVAEGQDACPPCNQQAWPLYALGVSTRMSIQPPPGLAHVNRFDALKEDDDEDADEAVDCNTVDSRGNQGYHPNKNSINKDNIAKENKNKQLKAEGRARTLARIQQLEMRRRESQVNDLTIAPLTIRGGPIAPVTTDPSKDWGNHRYKEILVDSGAAEHVSPSKDFPDHFIYESEGSRSGLNYLAANGQEIPNLGEQRISVTTGEGHLCGLKFQTADVTRPILSVPKLTASGHSCTFGKDGGVITCTRTGRKTNFLKKNGLYVLGVWVVPAPPSPNEAAAASGFQRQR